MIVAISSIGKASAVPVLLVDRHFAPTKSQQRILLIGLERSPQQVQFLRLRVAQRSHAIAPKGQARRASPSAVAENSLLLPSLLVETPTTSVPMLPTTLPPANIPIQQDGVVNVPPVNRPEASVPSPPNPVTPPALLPPAVFSTNQTPAVSVPSLQPISTQTPTPSTTPQPVEPLAERVSHSSSSSPVIEFGQPLTNTTE